MRQQLEMERTIRDPHHSLDFEWGVLNGVLYHKGIQASKWIVVRKVSPTPKRILALATLFVPPQK